jgi:hypothetical protein
LQQGLSGLPTHAAKVIVLQGSTELVASAHVPLHANLQAPMAPSLQSVPPLGPTECPQNAVPAPTAKAGLAITVCTIGAAHAAAAPVTAARRRNVLRSNPLLGSCSSKEFHLLQMRLLDPMECDEAERYGGKRILGLGLWKPCLPEGAGQGVDAGRSTIDAVVCWLDGRLQQFAEGVSILEGEGHGVGLARDRVGDGRAHPDPNLALGGDVGGRVRGEPGEDGIGSRGRR